MEKINYGKEIRRISKVLEEWGLEFSFKGDELDFFDELHYGAHIRIKGDISLFNPETYGSNDIYVHLKCVDGHLQFLRVRGNNKGYCTDPTMPIFPELLEDSELFRNTSWIPIFKGIRTVVNKWREAQELG